MRIAHLSDLHFSVPTWSPLQFFSKRWIGNVNLLFSRKRDFIPGRLLALPDLFKENKVEHVIICGDVSTTSQKKEFALAAEFASSLKEKGLQVVTVPGNHDQYTTHAYRSQLFYDYFDAAFDAFSLKEDGVTVKRLPQGWWIVALDTALATSLISSRGLFASNIEQKLDAALKTIPEDGKVILVNHFPFFHHDKWRVRLDRGPELQALIRRFPKIKLYLHGHTHRHCIADLRVDGLPIILDSGSTPHRDRGSWNLIDISSKGCSIDVFGWKDEWKKTRSFELPW